MKYVFALLFLSVTAQAQLIGDTETGLASYYSREYDGAETAYGLFYDRNTMVAAHKSFPVNSTVEVKNLDNGKSVRVKVIDKGPFIRGRVIEVSERAADLLGMLKKMTVPVEIRLVALAPSNPPSQTLKEVKAPTPLAARPKEVVKSEGSDLGAPPPATVRPKNSPDVPVVTPAQASNPKPVTAAPNPLNSEPAAAPVKKVAPVRSAAQPEVTGEPSLPAESNEWVLADEFVPGVYKINLAEKPSGDFGVQIASYRDMESAMDKIAYLQSKWFKDILIERVRVTGGSVFKVMLGPFQSEASAKRYNDSLKSRYAITGFVVEIEK